MKAFACANFFIEKPPWLGRLLLLYARYSARRLVTGLANAARRARKPMVSIVMAMASKAASAKIHQPMLIR